MQIKKNISAIHSQLVSNGALPVYFFYGEEEFMIDEAVHLIKKAFFDANKENSTDYALLWGNEVSVGNIISVASSYSMFSNKKLIVVRNFSKIKINAVEQKALEHYISNPLLSTTLILLGYGLTDKDLQKASYRMLKEIAMAFPKFKSPFEFISLYLERLDWKITSDALALFSEYVGNDSREISNEINKMLLFLNEKQEKLIESKDISKIVGVSKDYNIFALQNELMKKNLRTSAAIVIMILQRDKDAMNAMVAYLSSFFLKLLKIKALPPQSMDSAELATKIGLYGGQIYFVKQYKEYASSFSVDKIEKIFKKLHEIDLKLKGITQSTALPDVLAMELINEIVN
ncbi:hypothetical protein CHS0354_000657 [Potamilus streckersoni]|uniref:DNA polymerase III subunit delta n=1 Tax=Potamilus streckersoni TaxID=2493646 RepID=A0AAE0T711_9BIVA|nr:hypothetical protein CHS0354_000657 [Potamilus streckersoni]